MSNIANALMIFHTLVRDKRLTLACNARYSDHSVVGIELSGKYVASFDLKHDASNAVECALYALAQLPYRSKKAFSLRYNTLGKRAVYSLATVDASDFECYGAKHVRTSEMIAQALRDAVDAGILCERDDLSYCDAHMAHGKSAGRLWLVENTERKQ